MNGGISRLAGPILVVPVAAVVVIAIVNVVLPEFAGSVGGVNAHEVKTGKPWQVNVVALVVFPTIAVKFSE